jgi:DNA polymerase-4
MNFMPNPAPSLASRQWREGLQTARGEPVHALQEPEQGPTVNWLFVDLNSYFASVEQEVRPELRGRPVGIVPMMADSTCCIAASYEAKAYGVKTGTMVADAKRMCPGLVLVEARHEIYVDYHHRIVAAVESCLPVTAVLSIDEMACRLMGRERPLLAAMEMGRRVKARILERVGPMMRSSVGLATNRYLAKVASDMEKPDGLVALPADILAEALSHLVLRDLPGIGARTEKRLNERGIHTMQELLALDREQTGKLWGSVEGERLWLWLRGENFDLNESSIAKSLSHQHVLAPEMRTPEKAWAVAHKLLHKAAMRMRAAGLWAGGIGLAIGFATPRGESPVSHPSDEDLSPGTPTSRYGVPTRGWKAELRLSECQDNQTLIAALCRLWASRPAGAEFAQPYFIGVQLTGLVPDHLHSLSLFDELDGEPDRRRLQTAMDTLNNKYGLSTLAPATMLTAFKAAPTRIAFRSIPELF